MPVAIVAICKWIRKRSPRKGTTGTRAESPRQREDTDLEAYRAIGRCDCLLGSCQSLSWLCWFVAECRNPHGHAELLAPKNQNDSQRYTVSHTVTHEYRSEFHYHAFSSATNEAVRTTKRALFLPCFWCFITILLSCILSCSRTASRMPRKRRLARIPWYGTDDSGCRRFLLRSSFQV